VPGGRSVTGGWLLNRGFRLKPVASGGQQVGWVLSDRVPEIGPSNDSSAQLEGCGLPQLAHSLCARVTVYYRGKRFAAQAPYGLPTIAPIVFIFCCYPLYSVYTQYIS